MNNDENDLHLAVSMYYIQNSSFNKYFLSTYSELGTVKAIGKHSSKISKEIDL